MHAQLVGYDFKKKGLPTDKNIAVENSKVSNDYFWKTNEYTSGLLISAVRSSVLPNTS